MMRKFSDSDLLEILNGTWNGEELSPDKQQKFLLEAIKADSAFWFLALRGGYEAQEYDETRSRKILERLKNDPRFAPTIKEKPIKLSSKDFPDTIQFGQIFETQLPANWPYPYQERRMVLVLSDGTGSINPSQRDIKVAPICFETDMTSSIDLPVQDPEVLGGIPFLIRLSDTQNMFEAQLKNYYGKLPKRLAKQVLVLLKKSMGLPLTTEEAQMVPETSRATNPHLWKKEHRLTQYLRQPVLSMIKAIEQWPEAIVLDLTYWLPRELFKQLTQDVERIPIAAATKPDWGVWLDAGLENGLTVFTDDAISCKIVYSKDGIGLIFALENDKSIAFKIWHENDLLLSEVLTAEDHLAFIKLREVSRLFNKELRFEIQTGNQIISKKVVFYYEP